MVAVRYDTVFKLYPYRRVAEQDTSPRRHPVVIVGGGPVGLGIALDLGRRGTPVLVLDDHDGAGNGSKAICFAKRTLAEGAPIELRGRNAVTKIDPQGDHVSVEVDTPEGPYTLEADWLIACDGARSPVRTMMGLDFDGRVFEDNFLIADVRMTADFPTERWFWFDPPFKERASGLALWGAWGQFRDAGRRKHRVEAASCAGGPCP